MKELMPVNWKSSLGRLRERVHDVVDHWLSKFKWRDTEKENSWPAMNLDPAQQVVELDENDGAIIARVALPGLKKDDYKVEVTEDRLVIRGGKNRSLRRDGPDYYQYEGSSTSFVQAVSLPCKIDGDRVRAKFRRGLLTVTLPKAKGQQNHRLRITVA